MRVFLSLAFVATLFAAGPAQAQKFDLASLRCKELLDGGKENVGLIVMWLQGYFSEENAPPMVDFDRMKTHGGKLSDYCRKYPGHSVITAAEKVMDGQ
jgi:acid stress chaperone HdeB